MRRHTRKKAFVFGTVLLTLLCLTGSSVIGSVASDYPVTFVDDLAKEIHLAQPATRIISLYSAHTENLFSLGLDKEIIGVGRVDIYPPNVLKKPRFDYRSDPEKAIVANPDLILIRPFIKRTSPEFVDALEKVGFQVVALYPENFGKFDEYIRKLALLTGRMEKAEELLKAFHEEIRAIREDTKDIVPKVNVYFESVENGYKTVTPDSMPARAIEIAGGKNVAQHAIAVNKGSSIASYGVERILEQADTIEVFVSQQGTMNSGGNVHSISTRPGFHAINAVRNERIHLINEKIISSPTFRYVTGIRELSRFFYPERIDDISRFSTDEALTRGQMAEIAVRFKHKPIFVPTSRYYRRKHRGHTYGTFQDVTINHPRFDFIETAVFSGYLDETKAAGKDLFSPERKVTRDELARIIFMLHDFEKMEKHVTIKDLAEVSKPRIIQVIVDNGIMRCEDGYFYPEDHVTGREVVETLKKLKSL